ncbi:hypothetical protein B0T16DRAFT_394651 [Cercophora newfieldiana]|uniref:Uncharacterized protein n=1 Tax=Cercophora newfieldiana TaxID=92897 RepID=A0AA39XTH4_9PEZI|nr:hypothetical protein B0T16DRAFT_394651 [Cercophora newfieldiana]
MHAVSPKKRNRLSTRSLLWRMRSEVTSNSPRDLSQLSDTLDDFFTLLTTSPWAIPRTSLGDPSADDATRDAIKFQQGIIMAQLLATAREPAELTTATSKPGDNDASQRFNTTTTVPDSRRRVVQDPVSTRILQGLLGAALLLLVLSWLFSPRTAVLAGSPTSVATQAALVSGGNLLGFLPVDAQWRTAEEMAAVMGHGTRFWIGWGTVPNVDGRENGGENGAGLKPALNMTNLHKSTTLHLSGSPTSSAMREP